jgi:hypothetical protein
MRGGQTEEFDLVASENTTIGKSKTNWNIIEFLRGEI